MLLTLTLASCVSPRYAQGKPVRSWPAPSSLAADSILQRSSDPAAELEALPRSDAAPNALRRAALELQIGNSRAAIDATSQVLYGPARPAANAEALARYLRAKAYEQRGTADLAKFDLDRARELALDPQLVALLNRVAATSAQPKNSLARLTINGRSGWRAAPPNRRNLDPMDKVSRITIHHSAMAFRDHRPATAAAQLQVIQRNHMQQRGFGDIGYHFLIDPAGRIWQGRELRFQGAHASGRNNVRNAGICLLGNFILGNQGQQPTAEQVDSLQRLVLALRADFGIPPSKIYRHKDFKSTECPGRRMDPVMALLRGNTDLAQLASRE